MLGKKGLLKAPSGNRKAFVKCLRHLYQKLKGYRIYLYVDGAKWHKGEEVVAFLQTHKRLKLAYLPKYAPALNMQERIWRRIRYEITTNKWFGDLDKTWNAIRRSLNAWTSAKIMRLCQIN